MDYTPGGGGGGSCTVDTNINPLGTYIEAENFMPPMGAANPWAWEVRTNTITDGNGNTNSGDYLYTTSGGTGANTNGSRVDYPITIPAPGTYEIWVRAKDQDGTGGGDSVFWGVNDQYVGAITQTADNVWAWSDGTQNGTNRYTFNAAGDYVISMWPREGGQHFDAFVIYDVSNASPFTGNNDITTVAGDIAKTIDPSCIPGGGGGGSGTISIPDAQLVNGASLDLRSVDLATYDPGTILANEIIYDPTDQAGLIYRALGGESDGFHGFSVNPKWNVAHVGNDPPANNPSVSGGILTVEGSGTDIWNTNDFFTYLYQGGMSGDFTIDVEVKSLTNGVNAWSKAGIMIRQSLSTNSEHAMIVVTPSNGVRLQNRPTNGGSSLNSSTQTGLTAPRWLRLKRVGNTFTGYYSSDGEAWTQITGTNSTATINMTDPVNIGLAVTSHSSGNDVAATFDNFLFMPASTSGMSETWTGVATAIDTDGPGTVWVDGTYGLSIKSNTDVFETNVFDFSSCTDTTTSTITIPGGQTVQGSAVSLASLFTHTGNVGSFTYEINGAGANNPWNSYSEVPNGTSNTVTLRVAGTDPDCGGSLVAATGTITVDNTCIDNSPSTVTILTGQAVGGSTVDLTALHNNTGNVGSFTYKINGATVATPASWDSTSFGVSAAEAVSLEVTGTDPDCSTTIVAINNINVDNTCVRNPPSISYDLDTGYVGEGRAKPYKVTIRNEDSFNCSPTNFDMVITNDSNATDFEASYYNPGQSDPGFTFSGGNTTASISLAGRESAIVELAVEAKVGATEWNANATTLEITSIEDPLGAHNSPKTSKDVNTVVFLVSPITHNSVTTGSSKWGGNWGTSQPGSKYGNFDCLTCHSKTGPNVKWMLGDIATPDGTNWGISGQNSLPIEFKDARSDFQGANPTYWGNDDVDGSVDADASHVDTNGGIGRNASNRTCEVCHSTTWYHRYDTQTPPNLDGVNYNQQGRIDPLTGAPVGLAGLQHFPDRDCTDCHRHELGFTASCTGCHGDPPLEATLGGPNGLADIPNPTGSVTPGTHYKHTVVLGFPCEYCHAGWRNVGEMPKELGGKQDINHFFNTFFDLGITDPVRNNGHYTGQDGVSYEGTVIPPGQGTMTCENIYCHGGTESMGGSNPQWNGNIACNSCHGTSATNTPPGYSHTTHVGEMGLACTDCHYTAGNQAGYNGHVNGRVNIQLSPTLPTKGGAAMYDPTPGDGGVGAVVTYNSNADGTDMPPSTQYGSCLNIACHFGTETPVWNNGGQPATCTTCHNDDPDGSDGDPLNGDTGDLVNSPPNTGNHEVHVHPTPGTIDETMINTFVSGCESCHGGGANTGHHAGHVNLALDVGGGMTYSQPSGDGGTCTSQCHSLDSETGGTVVWGSPEFLDCSACHHAPYIGPTVVDPTGVGGASKGMAASGYGSHLKVGKNDTFSGGTNWTNQCRSCHPYHEDESNASYAKVGLPPQSWNNPGTGATEADDMRSKLGLNYNVTTGVHLGGSATSGTTEADICWNCHGTDTEINEWGYNHKLSGSPAPPQDLALDVSNPGGHSFWNGGGAGNRNHNYGYVYTTNHNASGVYTSGNATSKWVDANGDGYYRQDAYQHTTETITNFVSSRRITSVHSVNFDNTKQVSSVVSSVNQTSGAVTPTTQEKAADIRCTYCHDVHDLNRAVDEVTLAQETATGAPFLRGSWMANPYAADMPPLNSYSYPTSGGPNGNSTGNRFYSSQAKNTGYFNEPTPRLFAGTAMSVKGGFFIDANSNWPTSNANWDTVQETAGICITCHGTDVDNMDFYTSRTIWRNDTPAKNGHANSTLGGSGAGSARASDIFDATRGQTYRNMAHQAGLSQNEKWGKDTANYDNNGPFRNDMDAAMETANNNSNATQAPSVTGWYGGTAGAELVNWSERPAQYDTWYGGGIGHDGSGSGAAHQFSCSKCHSPHATGLPALLITNCIDASESNWTGTGGGGTARPTDVQANNCHRKTSNSDGWHRLQQGM